VHMRGVVNGMDLKVKCELCEVSTRPSRNGSVKTFKTAPVLLPRSFGSRNIMALSTTRVTVAGDPFVEKNKKRDKFALQQQAPVP
jgi:hypothetical protein